MGYADKKGIPYVALVGETEMQEGILSLKDMTSGEQTNLRIEEVIAKLNNKK